MVLGKYYKKGLEVTVYFQIHFESVFGTRSFYNLFQRYAKIGKYPQALEVAQQKQLQILWESSGLCWACP